MDEDHEQVDAGNARHQSRRKRRVCVAAPSDGWSAAWPVASPSDSTSTPTSCASSSWSSPCLYGLGAAIYLAMWVLIPQSGSGADDFEGSGVEPPASNLRLLRYVVLAAIVVIAVIAISTLGGAPRVGNGFAALWLGLPLRPRRAVTAFQRPPAHASALHRVGLRVVHDDHHLVVGRGPGIPRLDRGPDDGRERRANHSAEHSRPGPTNVPHRVRRADH